MKENLQQAYITHILHNGEQPKTVYLFAKENNLTEDEFYAHYGSFLGIEQTIWHLFFTQTIAGVKSQEIWPEYSSRDKALSLFFGFVEFLKPRRSFATFSLKNAREVSGISRVLELVKPEFEEFSAGIIQEGIESGELLDRPFFTSRYKDGLWLQFGFILNFWLNDTSAGFEKTDEAIEKGLNTTFNLFQRSPLDDIIDYGKFLFRNSAVRKPF